MAHAFFSEGQDAGGKETASHDRSAAGSQEFEVTGTIRCQGQIIMSQTIDLRDDEPPERGLSVEFQGSRISTIDQVESDDVKKVRLGG